VSARLRLRDVHVSYTVRNGQRLHAVRGVDLEVSPGEIVALVGESGCGKSSLARAVVGLQPLASGEVLLGDTPIETLSSTRRRTADSRRVQLVFQDPYGSLNPRRKVGAQIADGFRAAGTARAEIPAHVAGSLDLVGLPATVQNRFPHQFSGGQRQRLAIARALAANPSFLVADEPISALDASAQSAVASYLERLRDTTGLGILLISHDLAVVREIADRVAVMYLGKIVEAGPTATIWENPQHPYTRALIAAIPVADGRGVLPTALAGEVPDPAAPPPGCAFHPRCPLVQTICSQKEPPERVVAEAHVVRCVLAGSPPAAATSPVLPRGNVLEEKEVS
jgi:oligopeptide/dipeptide ABC transporter ATP-binding protein